MAGPLRLLPRCAPRAASGCLFHRVFQSIVNRMPSNSSATASADTGREDQAAHVAVFAPARLHLGFLDLEGGLGRRFGGLGLAIDGLGTRLRLAASASASASGPGAESALRYLARAAATLDLPPGARIVIDE